MALKDKVAIITGASAGLGAAVAQRLAERGANLVLNYARKREQAEATAESVRSLGVEAIALQGDVGEDADCRRMVEAVVKKWGRVDILVNNAATTKVVAHDDLEKLMGEDFIRIYRTNVVGAYQMTRACAPHMKAQGFGAVVNISSIASLSGMGSSHAYAASKSALNTMTMSLARALGPEIRVNAVLPGFMATQWFSDMVGGGAAFDEIVARQRAMTPLQRAGTPDDVANAVVFFCDEGAQHITGTTIVSDAGFHLGAKLKPLKPA